MFERTCQQYRGAKGSEWQGRPLYSMQFEQNSLCV